MKINMPMCHILSSLPHVNTYFLNQHLFPTRYLDKHKDFQMRKMKSFFQKRRTDGKKNNDFNTV